MRTILKGRVQLYAKDHINTDEILPARYLVTYKEEELAKHVMEDLDKNFASKVQPGDFLIAGNDFGCGSSREHALWALRGAGINGIIARSFSRIFYRNVINNGFLAIECKELDDKLKTGDEITVDLDNGYFIRGKDKYNFSPFPEFVKNIMDRGGLLNTL